MIQTIPLTQATIDQYNDEGWCLLGRVMDDETIEKLREEEAKFRNRPLHYDDPNPQPTDAVSQPDDGLLSSRAKLWTQRATHSPRATSAGAKLGLDLHQFVTKFPDANLGKSEFPCIRTTATPRCCRKTT
jgi:hypothetical protein